MRKYTCILTSEAKGPSRQQDRKMILAAYFAYFFDTENYPTAVIEYNSLIVRIKKEDGDSDDAVNTRKKFEALRDYMIKRDIDVVIIDDASDSDAAENGLL